MSTVSKGPRVAALAAAVAFCLGTIAVAAPPPGKGPPEQEAGDPNRVWVKFKNGEKANGKAALKAAGAKFHYEFDDLEAAAVTLPAQALNGLRHNKHIEYIEADPMRYPAAETIPWGIPQVQAPDAVNVGADGTDVKVCVIDSGIQANHEDFDGIAMDGYASLGQTWNTDTCNHGSHVAGTIAAVGNNNLGVVGVSPGKVSLHIIKYFDGASCAGSYSSTLVNAIQKCQAAGAKVINMSLKSGLGSTTEETAINNVYNSGVLLVAAAGNDGNTTKSYPASYTNVISVAATDKDNNRAAFSQYNDAVDIAAPGTDIASVSPTRGAPISIGGNTYETLPLVKFSKTVVSGVLADGGLCDAAGTWTNKIVLCGRGTVTTQVKLDNVKSGGAKGMILYNSVEDPYPFHAGVATSTTLTGVAVSKPDGVALKDYVGQTISIGGATSVSTNSYAMMQGTSMASPHVAGVAALLFSAKPSATPGEVREALLGTALDLGTAGRDNETGAGLVQAFDAVEALLGSGNPPANVAPVANFTSTTNGLTATFTDTSTDSDGNIASRAWTFGDGTTSSQANPSKTYTAAGTYSVKLTVTDDDGATHSVTKSVTVTAPTANQPPVANFTSTANGLTVSFTDTSTDSDGSIASRAWNFGDNTSSALANPSHTYAAAGTYTITLTVTDNNGATNSKTSSVVVTAPTNSVQTYTNATDVAITDNSTVTSTITVAGRSGNAPINAVVSVNILHTARGDLKVELVAPDGSAYLLKNSSFWDASDNLIASYTVNLSTETLNGDWKLRVSDVYANDTGKIDSWSIKF